MTRRKHVHLLAGALGVRLVLVPRWRAWWVHRRWRANPIDGIWGCHRDGTMYVTGWRHDERVAYYCALHELGHAVLHVHDRGDTVDEVLEREREAWAWARSHALAPLTSRIAEVWADRCVASYREWASNNGTLVA